MIYEKIKMEDTGDIYISKFESGFYDETKKISFKNIVVFINQANEYLKIIKHIISQVQIFFLMHHKIDQIHFADKLNITNLLISVFFLLLLF